MFPLPTETFPTTAAQLADALNESLASVFAMAAPAVEIRGEYPTLESLSISLDGATVRPDARRPAMALNEAQPRLQVEQLSVAGRAIAFGEIRGDLQLKAEGVRLSEGRSADGKAVIAVSDAKHGQVEVSTTKAALEKVIEQLAQAEAGKQGVNIDGVRLTLRANGPRAVSGEAQFRARKLFLSASIRIFAQLDLDDDLNAKLSGLRCEGDGAIASIACGFLAPHLAKMDGRVFPLMALPLGELRLRDVRLAVGETVSVSAEFNKAA